MILEQLYTCAFHEIPQSVFPNLEILLNRLQILEVAFGERLNVVRAFSMKAQHIAIYKEKNAKRKAQGLPPLCVPLHSKHLTGCAADISNPDLKPWILLNPSYMEELDFYIERFEDTPLHTHLQTQKFASYKPGKSRFFKA